MSGWITPPRRPSRAGPRGSRGSGRTAWPGVDGPGGGPVMTDTPVPIAPPMADGRGPRAEGTRDRLLDALREPTLRLADHLDRDLSHWLR